MNCRDKDKPWGKQHWLSHVLCFAICGQKSLGLAVSEGLEHQEIAGFELCEVRSCLNHVCLGWWYVFVCVYLSLFTLGL